MDNKNFDNKKQLIVFVFVLNTLIMLAMGIIIYDENLGFGASFIKFCRFVFFGINSLIIGVYFLMFFLYIIRIILAGGSKWLNSGETTYEYAITRKGSIESDGIKIKSKVKILDFIKDPVIIFCVLFLVFSILTFVFYFTTSPLALTIGSLVITFFMGVKFIILAKK